MMPEEVLLSFAPLLARYLAESRAVHLLAVGADGLVRGCNGFLAGRLKRPDSEIVGRPAWDLLTEEDAASLRERVQAGDGEGKFLLNFVDGETFPFTLECRLEVRPEHFLVIGEEPPAPMRSPQEELLRLNNELALLARESARKGKELERTRAELAKALEELKTSYWHLRKVGEVLPVCMECGKVKASGGWEEMAAYLKQNALFLSHGYCPECTARVMARWQLEGEL